MPTIRLTINSCTECPLCKKTEKGELETLKCTKSDKVIKADVPYYLTNSTPVPDWCKIKEK